VKMEVLFYFETQENDVLHVMSNNLQSCNL